MGLRIFKYILNKNISVYLNFKRINLDEIRLANKLVKEYFIHILLLQYTIIFKFYTLIFKSDGDLKIYIMYQISQELFIL